MVKFFSTSNGTLLAREVNNWLANNSEVNVVSIGYQNEIHRGEVLYSALVLYEMK